MANLVYTTHVVTTRTTTDHGTVPDQRHKAVGDPLHAHQAATTAQAHTQRDLAAAKAKAKTRTDLTIPKVKVKLRTIIVRQITEKVKLKVNEVKDAGGTGTTDTQPQPQPTQNHRVLQHYPKEKNQ